MEKIYQWRLKLLTLARKKTKNLKNPKRKKSWQQTRKKAMPALFATNSNKRLFKMAWR
jgi:hypothetical protein